MGSQFAKRSDLHLMRRLWHVLCGLICFIAYSLMDHNLLYWGFFSLFIAVLGFIVDFKRLKSQNLNTRLQDLFSPFMRKSEQSSFSGLPFYALGVSLSIFLYSNEIAIISILFLIFADPIASIVGVHYGKDRLLPNKTLQGTIAAFVTCFIVAFSYILFAGLSSPNIIMFCFFSAIVGALSEMISAFNIDDNLTIPVVSGAFMSILNLIFKVL